MSSSDDYEECKDSSVQRKQRDSEWDPRDVNSVLDNKQNIVYLALDDMLNAGQINLSKQNTVVLNAMQTSQARFRRNFEKQFIGENNIKAKTSRR